MASERFLAVAISKSRKLNLVPVFGDLSTLVIGLFILIIVVQISQLVHITHPEEIPIANYFEIGSNDFLSKADSSELDSIIRTDYFENIKNAFDQKRLVSISIEGHTDPDKLKKKEGRFATNNKQLSFMRAETVYKIFEKIVNDSFTDKKKQDSLIAKINLIGHGATHKKYDFDKKYKSLDEDSTWVVYEILDGYNDTLIEYSNSIIEYSNSDTNIVSPKERAKREAYKKRRRVEIVSVIKGFSKE